MALTIYVCPRWETVGIEKLKSVLFLTDNSTGEKMVSGILKEEGRSKRRVFKEGGYFTSLLEAQNHANALKMAEETEVANRADKLKKQGYFKGDMMKLPV